MMRGMRRWHCFSLSVACGARTGLAALALALALPALAQAQTPTTNAAPTPTQRQAPKANKAERLAGTVVRVTDGDSLWFQPADTARPHVVVRLHRIDAPETCQTGGPEARDQLREWVMQRPGELRVVGMDDYGRTVGELTVDGQDIARRLVEEGHAWSLLDKKGRGPLLKEEKMARALRRGLHASPGAVHPKEFRRSHGPCPRT